MDQYEIGALGGKKSKTLLSSVMFLERYKELVKPDGKILAIIDDSVLSGDSYSDVRTYIRSVFVIEAVISLPGDAFRRSEARVKTSVLILRKKQQGENQPEVFMDMAVRIGLETKIAKRIGAMTADLNKTKLDEIERIVTAYKSYKAGKPGPNVVDPSKIIDRLDAKYYVSDNGRKKRIWAQKKYTPVKVKSVLLQVTGRGVPVDNEGVYQFLQVNYQGEVGEGDSKTGFECSYRELFRVKAWDILMSNMGVGRGAIGIVPPHHEGKFVSNEYSILRAKTKADTIYYTGILRTKEILGDILTTTTGMNRGRITWTNIQEIDVPQFDQSDVTAKELVLSLETYWTTYLKFHGDKTTYFTVVSENLGLDESDAHERWLALKPPE